MVAGGVRLTADDQVWIAAHPVIRVGVDPSWPPFSLKSPGGSSVGIDPDLLASIGARLGLNFEFVPGSSWSEVYAAARNGSVDMLAGTALTAEREKSFTFTAPYFSFPVVIVTRNDEPILWSVLDLEGRRIVGVAGYVATSEMARDYPELTFLPPTSTVARAMQLVSDGKADAFITNLPNASFEAKTLGLTNLKIAGVMPERFNLRYAVRPDWPELVSLLDRAIATLSEADRQAVVHPWIRVDYERVIRWDLVWKTALIVLIVVAVVLSAVIFHNRRLARELVERIRLQREIKDAHDTLLQLNEDKTEMLQMAAHDLRGPLTGIQLAIDASVRIKIVPSLDALVMVDHQVRQMTGLLNNLLDVEALEHGRREFEISRIPADESLRSTLATFTPVAAEKFIRIDATIAEGLPELEVDPTALRQITDNLVSNAIKFAPKYSVVRVKLEQQNTSVRIEISDEGPGVAAHETERIFAKYVRGSATPTGGEKTTGLGLSIVRQLATAMNARVWCESRPTGGFFVLMIPIARPPTQQAERDSLDLKRA